jgi:hypothetical protein
MHTLKLGRYRTNDIVAWKSEDKVLTVQEILKTGVPKK